MKDTLDGLLIGWILVEEPSSYRRQRFGCRDAVARSGLPQRLLRWRNLCTLPPHAGRAPVMKDWEASAIDLIRFSLLQRALLVDSPLCVAFVS